MGDNCSIRQCVTIGNKYSTSPKGKTRVGNNVFFGAGCIVLGDITIGNNAVIGAGSIVLADVPENTTVVGTWKGKAQAC
jgi:serine acetyltransferase